MTKKEVSKILFLFFLVYECSFFYLRHSCQILNDYEADFQNSKWIFMYLFSVGFLRMSTEGPLPVSKTAEPRKYPIVIQVEHW